MKKLINKLSRKIITITLIASTAEASLSQMVEDKNVVADKNVLRIVIKNLFNYIQTFRGPTLNNNNNKLNPEETLPQIYREVLHEL